MKPARKLQVNDIVKIGGNHPFCGELATIVRFKQTPWGILPIAKIITTDHEVFIMKREDAIVLTEEK